MLTKKYFEAVTVATATLAAAVAVSVAGAAPASATTACGTVQVAASQWMAGGGVAARSNGTYQGTGTACAGWSTANAAVQDGYGWQCVELASRLYAVKGWGTVRADGGNGAGTYRYGAKYIPEGSPGLTWHPNGSGYLPVPGDLIIETNSTWGHVSVVDRVGGSSVYAVEQNASNTGRHTYTLSGSSLSGAYSGSVRGVALAPKNASGNSSGGYKEVFQANIGNLFSYSESGAANLGQGMMPGTSPSIAALAGGGYEMAFQANTGELFVYGDAGGGDTYQGMLAGTSPSIAASPSGGFQVAFQANNGSLYRYSSTGGAANLGQGMKNGTSPSIA